MMITKSHKIELSLNQDMTYEKVDAQLLFSTKELRTLIFN